MLLNALSSLNTDDFKAGVIFPVWFGRRKQLRGPNSTLQSDLIIQLGCWRSLPLWCLSGERIPAAASTSGGEPGTSTAKSEAAGADFHGLDGFPARLPGCGLFGQVGAQSALSPPPPLCLCFISLQVYKAEGEKTGKHADTRCSLPFHCPKIHTEG